MADNTVLPAGSGGDTIRAIARTANSPAKTQAVALDIGGASDSNAESIVSAANPLPAGVYDATGLAVNSLSMGTGQNGLMVALGGTNFLISTLNSSTAQLASNATFTGTIESVANTQTVSVDISSDQPGTLTVNQYITTNANSLCATASFSMATLGTSYGIARAFTLNGNYVSLTFKNTGASTTTLLNINTAYGTLSPTTQLCNTPIAIDEINGTALNIGQTTMAASLPVTIASNQTALPIAGSTGSALDAANGSAVPAHGLFIGGGSAAGGTTFETITVKAASTAAAATDTALVVQALVGNAAMSTAAAGVQKVGISGNGAATLDAVITAATAPANGLAILSVNETTAPSLTTGQSVAVQADYVGSIFVKPFRRSQTAVGNGTFTSITATTLLAAQATGIFADLATIVITQGIGSSANVYFTVNVSDGTNTYKFNMFSNDSASVTPTGSQPLQVTFDPPIPAASSATAWTVALSSATNAPTVNVTATFVLQKAS